MYTNIEQTLRNVRCVKNPDPLHGFILETFQFYEINKLYISLKPTLTLHRNS